jgi:hypothetical protein
MKVIIIEIRKGCAEVVKQDKGTRVIIRDFDCQEETEYQDSDGDYYTRQEFENP